MDTNPGRMPTDSAERKAVPLATGVLDYFPDALAEVARLSKIGNDKHNPGQPLHWARGKSDDHADCILRHMIDRGTVDTDGVLHDAKVAWRALAQLQLAIERMRAPQMSAPLVEPEPATRPDDWAGRTVCCVDGADAAPFLASGALYIVAHDDGHLHLKELPGLAWYRERFELVD